jgi:transposase
VVEARSAFFDQIKDVPLPDLVVLDESYATTTFTRLRGRSPRGVRLVSRVPHGHWKLLTVIAAMTTKGVLCGVTVDATTDADVFGTFVRQVLVPSLRPGQVVIMDNLAAHKVGVIRQAVEAVGARVLYLPPYSPDYSPIEPMWSKVKQHLRSIGARTVATVGEAVQTALASITESDCHGYFRHCGYTLHQT